MSEEFDHDRFMADLGESFSKAREINQMPDDELETAIRYESENVAKIVSVLYLAPLAAELVAAEAVKAEKRILACKLRGAS